VSREKAAARHNHIAGRSASAAFRVERGRKPRPSEEGDEAELDDIYETERRLLYVACTRAREHLLLTGKTPASEYLADFASIS